MRYENLIGQTMLVCNICGGEDLAENEQYYKDGYEWDKEGYVISEDGHTYIVDVCPLCQRGE
jgi:hypothetical protein